MTVSSERNVRLRRAWKSTLVVAVTFVATYAHWILSRIPIYRSLHHRFPWYEVELLDKGLVMVLVLGGLLIMRRRRIVHELRLDAPVLPALFFALICALPMVIGFVSTRKFSPATGIFGLIFMDLVSPVVEEIHVRGFGFWQLYHRLQWPFVVALLPQAVLTGLGHIEKGTTALQVLGIFSLMFSGAVLFSWLLERWRSLWVPFFLHAAMNGIWDLYSISGTVLGGWFPFAVQQLTVLLAVAITLWWQIKGRLPAQLEAHKGTSH